ncbi:hypothetical protein ABW19_dt0202065 [Dactylella cylindrospora]|nr:hypothetical protein ABW19_dt0202065 [Dactylella cylindrospora]
MSVGGITEASRERGGQQEDVRRQAYLGGVRYPRVLRLRTTETRERGRAAIPKVTAINPRLVAFIREESGWEDRHPRGWMMYLILTGMINTSNTMFIRDGYVEDPRLIAKQVLRVALPTSWTLRSELRWLGAVSYWRE